MEKEFVTYEIALALKELGFNEECLAYFEDKELTHGMLNSVGKKRYLIAPLWQQVIDWFRIKYNWLIVVDVANSNEYYAAIREFDEDGTTISKIPYKIYSIYEEAREHAILKAIELIKKNKTLELTLILKQ